MAGLGVFACGRRPHLSAEFRLKYFMYKESLMQMSKTFQKDISFSLNSQIAQAKMNSYLNLPVHLWLPYKFHNYLSSDR